MLLFNRHVSSIQPITMDAPAPQSSSTKSPIKSCMKVATLNESLKSCKTTKRSSLFGSTLHSPSHTRRHSVLSSSTTSSHQKRHHSIFATRRSSAEGAAANNPHLEADRDRKLHVDGEPAPPPSPGHIRQTLLKVLSMARLESSDGAGRRRASVIGTSVGRGKKAEDAERPFKGLVNFSEVTIREYELTASDNPAVRGGAAIEASSSAVVAVPW